VSMRCRKQSFVKIYIYIRGPPNHMIIKIIIIIIIINVISCDFGQAEMQWKFSQAEFPREFWPLILAMAEFTGSNCHLAELTIGSH
jgi:hypothetical protein